MNPPTSTSSAGSEDLPLQLDGPATEPSISSKKIPTAKPSSKNTGPTSHKPETSSKSMVTNSSEQTFLPGVSPASPFLSPGSEKAQAMTVSSGRRCFASFAKRGPVGSLLKTLLELSPWHSTRCFLTWRVRATKRRRLLFRLVPSMPRTEETDCGLLPTITAESYGTNQGGAAGRVGKIRPSLETMAGKGLFPTPSSRDWKDTPGMAAEGVNPDGSKRKRKDQLARVIYSGMWPTPHASDGLGGGAGRRKRGRSGRSRAGEVAATSGMLSASLTRLVEN